MFAFNIVKKINHFGLKAEKPVYRSQLQQSHLFPWASREVSYWATQGQINDDVSASSVQVRSSLGQKATCFSARKVSSRLTLLFFVCRPVYLWMSLTGRVRLTRKDLKRCCWQGLWDLVKLSLNDFVHLWFYFCWQKQRGYCTMHHILSTVALTWMSPCTCRGEQIVWSVT